MIALALPAGAVHADQLAWPPQLPTGEAIVTDTDESFITVPDGVELRDGVTVAEHVPTIDFLYFPGQTYEGRPWSVWGDGLGVGDHLYYTSIGDHLSPHRGEGPHRTGTAQVYEYNAETRELRMLVDLNSWLRQAGVVTEDDHYTPGKIHGRIDLGRDGWLYYATHRGSRSGTSSTYGYRGDWIFRTHPDTGETEIVAAHPIEMHCIPASVLDPERMIFYGATKESDEADEQREVFFAYDIEAGEIRKHEPDGFGRYAILAQSTGRLYYQGRETGQGKVYDPDTNEITELPDLPYVRAATRETDDRHVYAFAQRGEMRGVLWSLNTETEQVAHHGYAMSGEQTYVTAMEVDPSNGRYVYYVGGSHGGIADEGTPVMQWDTETDTAKVIAFVAPFYEETYGYTPDGTFGMGISESGDKLYITWNGNRTGEVSSRHWDSCALMVIHIPEAERTP